MTLTTVLVILLVLLLIGALPLYPYSRSWGYSPSGTLAVVVAIVAGLGRGHGCHRGERQGQG